ncbi:MAG: zf-HC2 domain-containing protein [Pyrinomonadaceae bacterium]
MNCNKCSELLDDFLGGTLSGEDDQLFNDHLQDCLACASVREDVHQIIEVARAERGVVHAAPPNTAALWARIVNEIEGEQQASRKTAAAAAGRSTTARAGGEGFWARTLHKRWELSFAQLSAAVASIAIVVAISTALGVRRLPGGDASSANTASVERNLASATTGGAMRNAAFNPEDYVRQQQSSLQYLQQRIEYRKARWSRRDLETFDRAMVTIDEAVNDSLDELRRNPYDDVSEEMLNSALRDKMELLRDFSQL